MPARLSAQGRPKKPLIAANIAGCEQRQNRQTLRARPPNEMGLFFLFRPACLRASSNHDNRSTRRGERENMPYPSPIRYRWPLQVTVPVRQLNISRSYCKDQKRQKAALAIVECQQAALLVHR